MRPLLTHFHFSLSRNKFRRLSLLFSKTPQIYLDKRLSEATNFPIIAFTNKTRERKFAAGGEAEGVDFVLGMADGSETKLSLASFKEVYGQFREIVRVERQFEAKWENALGMSGKAGASYRVRSR